MVIPISTAACRSLQFVSVVSFATRVPSRADAPIMSQLAADPIVTVFLLPIPQSAVITVCAVTVDCGFPRIAAGRTRQTVRAIAVARRQRGNHLGSAVGNLRRTLILNTHRKLRFRNILPSFHFSL